MTASARIANSASRSSGPPWEKRLIMRLSKVPGVTFRVNIGFAAIKSAYVPEVLFGLCQKVRVSGQLGDGEPVPNMPGRILGASWAVVG